ncbi:MAG: sensor histidine kinase [Chloroflexi bacterium]|nr:sensor histidine kinase [Chloroflexota bacterium]
MADKYQRDIYVFLSLYRFFAYGLAVILFQRDPGFVLSDIGERDNIVLAAIGVYTLLKVLGPLQWWRADPSTYVVLGGDAVVAAAVLLMTGALNSPYLLYSLSPVIAAAMLFQERLALAVASLLSVSVVVAHVSPLWFDTDYSWVLDDNFLLWMVLYVSAAYLISTAVYRSNLNIRRHIETEATMAERRRIRREIHDGLAQMLTTLTMKSELVGKFIERGRTAEALTISNELHTLSQDLYQEVRDSLDELSVEPFPFIPVLKEYVQDFAGRSGIETRFQPPEGALRLPPSAELQFLRIVQEALSNVRRHSHASRAWVRLLSTSRTVELSIQDNGDGFAAPPDGESASGADGQGHHGIDGMRERAESLGATLNITSEEGQGTLLHVVLPRNKVEF